MDDRATLPTSPRSGTRTEVAGRLIHHESCLLVLCVTLAGAGCTSSDTANVVKGPLSPLHAELDPIHGGRFVDAQGREVVLSGTNVNSLGEYWQFDPNIPTVFPFGEEDVDVMEDIGWNAIRLVITWSRVEPSPGEYDESYLDEIEATVRLIESRNMYTIIDLHQDAWDISLAARDDENCGEDGRPASGWDGAPAWATLDSGAPRCVPTNPAIATREFSPAVLDAFLAFWQDAEGPGGVGIQTRFHAMLTHLAERLSKFDAVAGYDPMNEPNAWSDIVLTFVNPGADVEDQTPYLSAFYERALQAIRDGERRANSPNRLMLFEPSPDWAQGPFFVLPVFEHDSQVVYSPHIYQGGITSNPLTEEAFTRARDEAAMYGGVPVLSGEWGTGPARALDPDDHYFERHQGFQDQYRVSATQWLWRAACGDPHYAPNSFQGVDLGVWGFYDVDCPSNTTVGFRDYFADVLRRPLLRAAPGPIDSVHYDYESGRFAASGREATPGQTLLLFIHHAVEASEFNLVGLENLQLTRDLDPGQIWSADATDAAWSIEVDL